MKSKVYALLWVGLVQGMKNAKFRRFLYCLLIATTCFQNSKLERQAFPLTQPTSLTIRLKRIENTSEHSFTSSLVKCKISTGTVMLDVGTKIIVCEQLSRAIITNLFFRKPISFHYGIR